MGECPNVYWLQVLNCPQMRDNITMRISDMRKLVDGASQELVNLSR